MISQFRRAGSLLSRSRFEGGPVFLAGLFFQLVLHFEDDTANHAVPVWLRAVIIFVLHLAYYSAIKFLRAFVLPVDRGRFQLLKAATVLVAGAAIRGVLLYSMTNSFHLYTIDNLAFRVTNSIQIMTLLYAVIGVSDQAYRDWRERKNDLVRNTSRLALLLRLENDKAQAEHTRLVDTVTGQLLRFVRDIEGSTSGNIVDNLRTGISTIVRPLTREIDESEFSLPSAKVDEVRISWRQIVSGIGQVRPMEPAVVPIILMIASFPYVKLHFGLEQALELGVVLVAVSVTSLGIFDLFIESVRGRIGWLLTWVLVILASLITGVITDSVLTALLPGQTEPVKLMLILTTFTTALSLMIGLNKSLFHQIAVVESDLVSLQERLTWALARETEIHRQRSRSLAMALHGPVQTAVGAGIIRLENAAKQGVISEDLISEVRDLIYASLEQLQRGNQAPVLTTVLDELRETWSGICDIEVVQSKGRLERVADDPVTNSLIAEFVPELCFNAIKHGNAKRIKIQVGKPGKDSIEISLDDDGVAFAPGPKQGLGLKYLSESVLSLSRVFINDHNVVTISLPFKSGGGAQNSLPGLI